MGISIQRRRGTTSEHSFFVGKPGEVTVDTTKNVVVVHDGVTAGGNPLASESHWHTEVSSGNAGFMSAADKIKLDSIVGGTINYQIVQTNGTPVISRAATNFSSKFSVTDDGGGDRTIIDLADSGVGASTYTKVTVDTKGRVTTGTTLSTGDVPNLTASKITDFNTTVRTNRLDQMAVPTSDVSLNSRKIINVADPVSATDAANKQYVDATATGLTFKAACRVATTGTINMSAPGTTIDTVSMVLGDRILVKNQSDATKNGIYVYNGASSALTRTLDADSDSEVNSGMFILVTEGYTNSGVGFVLSTPNPIILGSTELTFVQFSSSGGAVSAGNGIDVNSGVVSVHTASSSRIDVGPSGVDLATIGGLTPGTYQQFTVDAYGRITGTTGATWQPSNAGLTALAGLAINGFVARTGSNTFAARTVQPGTGISITNGDGAAGNMQISVSPNTTKQQVTIMDNGSAVGTRGNVNLIPGTGASFTIADNVGSDRVDVTIGLTPGGGAAPSTSQYVTLATDANLTNERVMVAGIGISLTDGGSGNNLTVAIVTDFGSIA